MPNRHNHYHQAGGILTETPLWVDGALVKISQVSSGRTVGKVDCAAIACFGQIEKLKSLSSKVAVKNVVIRAMPFVGKVYNLKVRNGQQYLVGEDGVVVRDW